MTSIKYNGKEIPISFDVGALYRFELYGFSFQDMSEPGRSFQAQVALVASSAHQTLVPLEEVAQKIEEAPFALTEKIGKALEECGAVEPVNSDELIGEQVAEDVSKEEADPSTEDEI